MLLLSVDVKQVRQIDDDEERKYVKFYRTWCENIWQAKNATRYLNH